MNFKKFFNLTIAALLLTVIMIPGEADAVRTRHNNSTATQPSPQTSTTNTKSSTVTNSRSRNRKSNNTVTNDTRNAASKASNNTATSNGGKTKYNINKPNLEEVMETTRNPSSKYYYPNLWAKYNRRDTTMTPDEFRYLYLGYMFQEDYDPYRESIYAEKTESIRNDMNPLYLSISDKDFKKLRDDEKKRVIEQLDTLIHYSEKALDDNPFDLRQMSFLVHVLKQRGKPMKSKVWEYRLEHLLGAIKSTGTGDSKDNAWFVIYPMHEYDMVQLLGYEAVDVEYIDPGFDHLIVKPDGSVSHRNPAKGFYFNVVVPQQQYDLKHPEGES